MQQGKSMKRERQRSSSHLPSSTMMLGMQVSVESIDLNDAAGFGQTCPGRRKYATSSTEVFTLPVEPFVLHV
jgi:hypothetical protein